MARPLKRAFDRAYHFLFETKTGVIIGWIWFILLIFSLIKDWPK